MKSSRRAISGVLLLDKHADLSSNTAVGWAKRLFNAVKAGHTGTLDPFATGLLPICFGEAAKFARFMLDADKAYRATLKLGQKSSTGDTEGEIVEIRTVIVDDQKVNAVLANFMGTQTQIPPMHSALKQGGVPLYKLARQGLEVERVPRDINITALRTVSLVGDELVIDTVVSKGTYIRVLAEDIGEALGCGAHLTALRRTATGGFGLASAVTLETLEVMEMEDREAKLLPADALAMALPDIRLDDVLAKALQNGKTPRIGVPLMASAHYRAYDDEGTFLGVATASECDAGGATLTALRMMTPHIAATAETL